MSNFGLINIPSLLTRLNVFTCQPETSGGKFHVDNHSAESCASDTDDLNDKFKYFLLPPHTLVSIQQKPDYMQWVVLH